MKGINTRQQIIDATERIIQARGIAHATTKEIAREAGCAEGTLYKHFEHKEDLFLTVLEQHLPSLVEALDESLAGQETVRANLERIAQAAIRYYDQLLPRAVAFFADIELLTRHRQVMSQINGGPQRIYERVASYVSVEQRLGRINPRLEPLSIASLLLGPCFQYAFNRHFLGTNPLEVTDQQFVAGLVQTLMEGIAS